MAGLFSQYSSGVQFTAGTIAGSTLGTSGLNPIVDRLNSISTADNLVTGSLISGTTTTIFASGGNIIDVDLVNGYGEYSTAQSFGSGTPVTYTGGSIVITSTGGSVLTQATVEFNPTYIPNPIATYSFRLSMDDSENNNEMSYSVLSGTNVTSTGRVIPLLWVNSPSAGAHTYSLQVDAGTGSVQVSELNMSSTELRN